ncbi:EscE/YscE/SsaE family type III secretion system needle protein co-chaperone [Cupriavidus sp. AU9028]|uniref:EscE/YscE/SsaE family type III secretion system needle protein co-chaperone n=1 Tax=Cupriavidus sp. AU9028 TaxID=2871157 RepID=UPI001C97E04A|nr:EscE/YscE/SsaE family type III secretion system needle protein co-chaperone [Cupriavidus sp. AU9028]MBY4897890.1 EscE/YscE/SsaE family type III secretion system needle protein co-chaperone [Cupriavidus sp. AU9028]
MDAIQYPTSIEAQLARDTDGTVRKRLKTQLQRALRQIEAELARPQPTDVFAELTALRDACVAGKATIDKAWRRARKAADCRAD